MITETILKSNMSQLNGKTRPNIESNIDNATSPTPKPNPWDGAKIPVDFTLKSEGLFKTDAAGSTKDFISKPIWLHAIIEDAYTGVFGVVLCWIDLKGIQRQQPFGRGMLYEQNNGIVKLLGELGLSINSGKVRELKTYLSECSNICPNFIQSVSSLGWFSTEKLPYQLTYVLPPDRVLTKNTKETIIFKPEKHSPTTHTIRDSGDLDAWKNSVATMCRGNPLLVFALCVPFAAPLLKYTNIDSFGFHLFGLSSRGKTTAAQVAASVYGCGADPADAPDLAYIQRWNSTGNAFEGLAAAHNDGLLVLDELHTCDTKDFGTVIFNLLGGKGKNRLTKESELRRNSTWRLILFSTGEISSKRKVEDSGQTSQAGQRNRLLDIPIGEDNIIENTGRLAKGKFALKLKKACTTHYGTAGPAFISALIEQFDDSLEARHYIEHRLDEISDSITPSGIQPEQARALRRLALIQLAGQMASDYGILPISREEVNASVQYVLTAWIGDESNLPHHIQGAVLIQAFILRSRARFYDLRNHHEPIAPRDLAGYVDGHSYMFLRETMNEIFKGSDYLATLKHLRTLKVLDHEANRMDKKVTIIGLGRPRLIVIDRTFIDVDLAGAIGATGQSE